MILYCQNSLQALSQKARMRSCGLRGSSFLSYCQLTRIYTHRFETLRLHPAWRNTCEICLHRRIHQCRQFIYASSGQVCGSGRNRPAAGSLSIFSFRIRTLLPACFQTHTRNSRMSCQYTTFSGVCDLFACIIC